MICNIFASFCYEKMKKIAFLIILLLFCTDLFAQLEASNWYFGSNAGIRFNDNGTTTNLTDGRLNTDEGCTTISDSDGNLLFYTDGKTVWNRLHQPMSNASEALGNELFGDRSSTQSAIVVPKPEDSNIYYVFTVDTAISRDDPDRGFSYSVVDLRLNGGLGDVVPWEKNINLLQDSSEKISAVLKDCISKSIWVITFASEDGSPNQLFNTFHAYEVSTTGINTTAVKSTFNITIDDQRGYLKLSPDGSKLACANSTSGLYLYDFDTDTGIVSNQKRININHKPNSRTLSPYGVEFSQSSSLLYVSAYFQTNRAEFNNPLSQYGALLQYNLNALNINNSEIIIDERQMYRGALQLAPNGKIYRAMSETYNFGLPFLSVINNPNEIGPACNYEHNAVSLSRNSRQGLPPFIASFFSENINITQKETNVTYLPLCFGETYTLEGENIPDASYTWFLDDVELVDDDFDLEVTSEGEYKLIIQENTGDCGGIFEGFATVEFFDSPIATSISDIQLCDDNNDGSYQFLLSSLNDDILQNQDPLIYNVKYFKSQEDADLNQNELLNSFEVLRTSQTIYSRVGLLDNTTCFDTSVSFNIQIFDTPVANTFVTPIICDERSLIDPNVQNGITEINLRQFDNEILGNQNALDFSITYHNSIDDAEARNKISFDYTNTTAFNEIIYARIENRFNPNCYAISQPIDLVIRPLPQFSNSLLLQCDADDLMDGFTIFNLTEAESELVNNQMNRTVKFFRTFSEAQNSDDEILNTTSFSNTKNPETLFAQVIDENTGCFDVAELILQVSTTSIGDYVTPSACDELGSEDGLNTFDLNTITASIQSINSITFPVAYFETYEDALLEKNELNSSYNNTTPYNQTIFARVENNNACYGISEVLLTVNTLPEIETEGETFYCLNKFPETITLDAGILAGNPADYNYSWSNGESSFQTEINEAGIYTVEVTNANNCSKTRTIVVNSSLATFNSPPYSVTDGVPNNSVIVLANIQGPYEYALYDENNFSIYRDFQTSNVFDNIFPGIYTIRIKDVNDECGTIIKSVSVIGFPKFFTPNNDGFHDTWQVYGVSDMFQQDSKIMIFDRLGKLVKQLSPKGKGWDGTYNGQILPTDDYWFSVALQDGRIFKSHFTLKR